MKLIGVIPNLEKDKGLRTALRLLNSIEKRGGKSLIAKDAATGIGRLDLAAECDELFSRPDILVVLGGDGSFLDAARMAYDSEIPILGVNLGRLGFLTEFDESEIEQAVEQIMDDRYEVEKRMALCANLSTNPSDKKIAVNDVVVSRGAFSRIIEVELYIDGIHVDSYTGDGLIIATPTGSTAYSLSAGGPIVDPGANLIIVTPICPHKLNSRSFIVTEDKNIRVSLKGSFKSGKEMLTIDGQQGYGIENGDTIEIRKAEKYIHHVRIKKRSFYDIVREKMYFRG